MPLSLDMFLLFPLYRSLKRKWRRRKYKRLDGARARTRKLQVVRLGGNDRRSPRVRPIAATPKRRLSISSPIKIFARMRDAYMNAMLGLSGTGVCTFGEKRVPMERTRSVKQRPEDFQARLVLEIYKSIAASRQVSTVG